MDYKVVNIKEKLVVGSSIVTSNQENKIGECWSEFINGGIYQSIPNKKDSKAIGLYYDYKSDMTDIYNFMCCVEVEKKNSVGLKEVVIPQSNYAKFTIKGNMITDVIKVWQKIWEMDLDRKYSYDFEVYHNDSEDINNQTIDIYISIN